jgi:hypothetical protein
MRRTPGTGVFCVLAPADVAYLIPTTIYEVAYSSAERASNSNPTKGSSPSTHAS